MVSSNPTLQMSPSDPLGSRPLEGIRIVSMAEQYPGPFATLILSDLGADVVLVERPGGGDPSRGVDADFFDSLNRGKRSCVIDLKSAAGKDVFRELVRASDVVLEGFRPGKMASLGLAYEDLRLLNGALIYVSVSGFGQFGPLRDRPAHDLSFQAMAGLMYEHAADDSPWGWPPMALGDLSAGLFTAVSVLVGLVSRNRASSGSYFDVSMFDGLASLMTTLLHPALNPDRDIRVGLPKQPAYERFRTGDGWITISAAHEDHFWRSLCVLLDMNDVSGLSFREREVAVDSLTVRIQRALEETPTAHWERRFEEYDLPFGTVRSLPAVVADAQLAVRDMFVTLSRDGGKVSYIRQPLLINGRPFGPRRCSPSLGEHTRELLAEIGYSSTEVDAMVESGVVGSGGEGLRSQRRAIEPEPLGSEAERAEFG